MRTTKEMSITTEQNPKKLLDRFEIVLDNTEEVYFAGQEMTGKVVIECSEPRQLNEVLFEVKGRARTHWVQSRKTCSANEAYFCEQLNTSYTSKLPKNDKEKDEDGTKGGGSSGRRPSSKGDTKHLGRTLPPGVHQIPFSYTLPKHLPSSFEGDFGFVRYTCRAICERPWDFDIVCFLAFTVIGIEDLNNQDAELLSLPMETHSSHPVTWLCMKLGAVQTEFHLAKGGYTPGEEIHLNLRIQNDSRRSLRGLNVRLYQNVTYRSKTFAGAELQRTTRHIVQKVVLAEKIRRGAEFSCQDRTVPVPSIPPKMVTKCKLIDISYCLELHCNSPIFSVSLPVTIGTIPLLSPILAKMNANGNVVKAITGGGGTSSDTGNNGTKTASKDAPPTDIRVKITDESGKTVVDGDNKEKGSNNCPKKKASGKGGEEDRMDPETERLQKEAARKRVRMPSSVLSELYPALPSPYYRDVYSGAIPFGTDQDREKKFHFGQTEYAPKYPFYE